MMIQAFEIADNVVSLVSLTSRSALMPGIVLGARQVMACGKSSTSRRPKLNSSREQDEQKSPEGFVLAALHWQRGWKGDVRRTYWTDEPARLAEAAD